VSSFSPKPFLVEDRSGMMLDWVMKKAERTLLASKAQGVIRRLLVTLAGSWHGHSFHWRTSSGTSESALRINALLILRLTR
jgi:hypothetical protein